MEDTNQDTPSVFIWRILTAVAIIFIAKKLMETYLGRNNPVAQPQTPIRTPVRQEQPNQPRTPTTPTLSVPSPSGTKFDQRAPAERESDLNRRKQEMLEQARRNYLEKNTTPNPNVPVPSSQPQQPQQPQPTPTTPVAVNPPRTSKSPLSTSRTSSNSQRAKEEDVGLCLSTSEVVPVSERVIVEDDKEAKRKKALEATLMRFKTEQTQTTPSTPQ